MSMPAEDMGNFGTLDRLLEGIAEAPAIDIARNAAHVRQRVFAGQPAGVVEPRFEHVQMRGKLLSPLGDRSLGP